MSPWKFLKYAAVTIFGLFVVLLAAIVILNAFDEDLSPEIVALVARAEAEQIVQQGNAYFSIRGLHAPHGQDIELAGRVLDEADLRAVQAFKEKGEFNRTRPVVVANDLKFEGQDIGLCTVIEDYLFENGTCKNQVETDRVFQNNRELLQRYYSLLDLRIYEDRTTSLWFPQGALISLMKLANVDIEKKIDTGQIDQAARLMSKNLLFWRNLLDGKYHLVTGAIVRVNYSYSLSALSELLWRKPGLLNEDFRTALRGPLIPSAASLQAQMDREFIYTYFVKQGSDLLSGETFGRDANPAIRWLANRMYQKNATLNAYHACIKNYYSIRGLSGAKLDEALARYQSYEIEGGLIGLAANLTGKIALLSMCPTLSWFSTGIPDNFLEARRRLILLEIKLLSSKLSESHFPALLSSADSGLSDPVTGRHAKWDTERHAIYYEREQGCGDERLRVRMAPNKDSARCQS